MELKLPFLQGPNQTRLAPLQDLLDTRQICQVDERQNNDRTRLSEGLFSQDARPLRGFDGRQSFPVPGRPRLQLQRPHLDKGTIII